MLALPRLACALLDAGTPCPLLTLKDGDHAATPSRAIQQARHRVPESTHCSLLHNITPDAVMPYEIYGDLLSGPIEAG
jgi:hypothetical protein